jgi:HK97 family phage portal protein
VARFLPSLRSGETKPHPALVDSRSERKVVLGDYYATLAAAGIDYQGRSRPWPIERAMAEGYERVVWVFNSVEWIAGNSARLDFRLRNKTGVVEDHPLYHVLNKRANPLETGYQFRKRLSAQILLSKRGAFVEVTKARSGAVIRADLLPPGRTRPIPGSGKDLVKCFAVWPRSGGKPREIPPENVRWFREPHPIDPYAGVTPLESIGMSIELDYFSRLYNVSFMRNDGRPGGVLGVNGDIEDEEMDRIEARFGRGPVEAGKLSVIQGELKYIDLAATPRDMQYGATSKNAKLEILAGFMLGESLFNASERTFANAEQEEYNAWTGPVSRHNRIVVSGWDEDSDDDLVGFLDTSEVQALQIPERSRREEARGEVAAGLRSIYSYAKIAGHADEMEETAETRALWRPAGSTPIAAKQEDVEALKKDLPTQPAGAVPAGHQDPAAAPGGDAPSPAPRPGAPAGRRGAVDVVRAAHESGALAATGTDGGGDTTPPPRVGGFRFKILRGGGA